MAPNSARTLTARLRARFAQDRVSKADFDVAIAGILAACPKHIGAGDSLLFSQGIRDLKVEWLNSLQRPMA